MTDFAFVVLFTIRRVGMSLAKQQTVREFSMHRNGKMTGLSGNIAIDMVFNQFKGGSSVI